MKKQLLLGSALLAAISAFPQSGRTGVKPSGISDMGARLASKYEIINNPVERAPIGSNSSQPIGPVMEAGKAGSSAAANWVALSGSMNIYGMLVSNSKPLNYNADLNTVTFVHRKSNTYVMNPMPSAVGAVNGGIVALVGAGIETPTWDSTLVWNNATNWARYPQGGIYNPPGNTTIGNAYVVAMGPLTQANTSLGWVGSYFASKQLGSANYDNVASATPNAQQFISNTAPYATGAKIDFPRCDFAFTNDGAIRGMGIIANNVNGTGTAYGWRGASIAKGTFNSGVFSWTADTIIPPVVFSNVFFGGSTLASGQPHMCWNNSGTVGYVWFIGARSGATNANSGYQPIVFKTTNSGASWTPLPGINFNSGAFDTDVLNHISSTRSNTNITIPYFNSSEGVDGIVDANDKLHIVSCLLPTATDHPDSLAYNFIYTNADGEQYNYPHAPGIRPYIYDFTETNNGWNVTVIDSMSSEAPGERSGDNGYGSNPWDPAGGSSGTDKLSSDARMQLSRSTDGKYIIYTWAESDTNFTSSSFKWNSIPNIKARAVEITTGANGSILNLSPTEINVTNPSSGAIALVASRAQMHYTSPRCAASTASTSTSFTVTLPMTVSNNQNVPMTQLLPNTHWYSSANMVFQKYGVGIAENALNSVKGSEIYPNPATGSAKLAIGLKDNSKVEINVMNLVGDVVKSTSTQAEAGENTIDIDLSGLSRGIYLVNVKIGNANVSKKLIVE
ncbi:MAG: T9SS type A sorting domain-containing protein [Bacteroidia bacterium]|nr:T9SS type A sorting domain-containing protein [Bacteroidia bacterium]